MKKYLLSLLSLSFALSLFALAPLKPQIAEDGFYKGLFVAQNVTYKTVDKKNLDMDIVYPEGEAPKEGWPIIIYLHGGGWMGGYRSSGYGLFPDEIRYYNKNGIAVAPVSYRLVQPNSGLTIENCVIDVKDAARFLVKNSSVLKINPKKMGAYGHSAGGHLTLMLVLDTGDKFAGDPALKDTKISFACGVPQSGPTSFIDKEADDEKTHTSDPNKMYWVLGGKPFAQSYDLRKLVSPSEYLAKKSPPMLLVQGEKDDIVSQNAAIFFVEKAKKIGAPMELLIVKDAMHSFEHASSPNNHELADIRRAYFLKYLKF